MFIRKKETLTDSPVSCELNPSQIESEIRFTIFDETTQISVEEQNVSQNITSKDLNTCWHGTLSHSPYLLVESSALLM